MFGNIEMGDIILAQAIVIGFLIIPIALFVSTLHKVLLRCDPKSRTISPASVWLLFVPVFGLVWQFNVVLKISESLNNEFIRRNIKEDTDPGKSVGIVMCILNVISVLPLIGVLAGLGSLICWINYWIHISGYSKKLI